MLRDIATRGFGRALTCLVAALLVGCRDRGLLSPPTLEPLEVHVEGRWLRDRKERIVLLRGVSLAALEQDRWLGSRGGPGDKDFAELAAIGANVIRVPLAWRHLEPKPALWDGSYLANVVDHLVRTATAHGMVVVLYMRPFGPDECALPDPSTPAWVCQQLGGTAEEGDVFPPTCGFWRGAPGPAGHPLLWHYARAWQLVARRYADDTRVAGFDVMDEPFVDPCLRPGEKRQALIEPTLRKLRAAIAPTGAIQATFFQPAIAPSEPLADQASSVKQPAVYAPHLYSQTFGAPPSGAPDLAQLYADTADEAADDGTPLFVGAFGGDGPLIGLTRGTTLAFLRASLAEMDRHRLGGAFFAYLPASSSATIVDAGEAAATRKALQWPYARRIAGIPLEMAFSTTSRELRLHFAEDDEHAPSDPSEIFLPARELYPEGFEVDLSDGSFHFDARTQRLLVYRGGGREHTVLVRPRRSSP